MSEEESQANPEAEASQPEDLSLDDLATSAAEALAGQLGKNAEAPLEVSSNATETTEAAALWRGSELLVASCALQAEGLAQLHVVTSRRGARILEAFARGDSAEDITALDDAPFDPAQREAIENALKHAVDCVASAVAETLEAKADPADSVATLGDAVAFRDRLGGGECVQLSLRVAVGEDGAAEEQVEIILSSQSARTRPTGLVSFDHDEARLGTLRAVCFELGVPFGDFAPMELQEHGADYFACAKAVIVPWDLGSLTGIEVVEMLRCAPALDSAPVVLAHEAPTASIVRAALRARADSFLHLPYAAGELRTRLSIPSDVGDEDPAPDGAEPNAD